MAVKVREKSKGSGVWWVFINHQGKRRSKRIGKDKRFALDVAKKIAARLVLGDIGIVESTPAPTFSEYASMWLDDYIKTTRRAATHERYKGLLKIHIYPRIGNVKLSQLKRSDIKRLLLDLRKQGFSISSVNLAHHIISGVMIHAMDAELIQSNPCSGILKTLRMQINKRLEREPLDSHETALFLRTCAEHYPEYHTFFLTGFRTGMRLGEIIALHWGDIDWNKKFIQVKQSYKRGKISLTKNGKERRIDISDNLYEELRKLFANRKREAFRNGMGDEIIEIVFHRDGKYIEQNYIRRMFKRILRIAGIREMRPHDMRHSYASQLLSSGISPVYVKEQLGHLSIQTTVDIYGHFIPNSNRSAVNSLDLLPEIAPTCTLSAPSDFQEVVNH